MECVKVQQYTLPAIRDVQLRHLLRNGRRLFGALLCSALSVEHVGTRHFMVSATHEAEFHMILDIFDMKGAAAGARPQQGPHHCFRQVFHRFAHAG